MKTASLNTPQLSSEKESSTDHLQNDALRFSREEAFSRNIGLISKSDLERLRMACIAIPGLGGVGGSYAPILARQGVGRFKLADFDIFELPNFNRQLGANIKTLGQPKLDVMTGIVQKINPEIEIEGFPKGIGPENIDHFLQDVDVVLDSLDAFTIDTRRLLFRKAYEKGIPVVTAGPLGFGAALQVVHPDGMSFDEYYGITDEMSEYEKLVRFFVGLAPKGFHIPYMDISKVNLHKQHGPSSTIAIHLCAAVASMEAIKLILGWKPVRTLPCYSQYDARRGIWFEGKLWGGNKNPLQQFKIAWARRKLEAAGKIRDSASLDMPTLLSLASLAPSADNNQPWKITTNDHGIEIGIDEAHVKPSIDIQSRMARLSIGAYAENLAIASSRFGYQNLIQFHESAQAPASLASIKLSPCTPHEHPLEWAIEQRWTNRFPYDIRQPISANIMEEIRETIEGSDFMQLTYSTHSEDIPIFANAVADFEAVRFSIPEQNKSLLSSLKTNGESKKSNDGLPFQTLGLNIMDQCGLFIMRALGLHHLMATQPFVATTLQSIRKTILQSRGIMLLSAPAEQDDCPLQWGRLMQRVWLKATSFGLSLQPFYAPAHFVFLMRQHPDLLSPQQREQIQKAHKGLASLFNVPEAHKPIVCFRLGFSNRSQLSSGRRKLSPPATRATPEASARREEGAGEV